MIEFKAQNKPKLALVVGGIDGASVEVTFTAPKSVLRQFESLDDKPLMVTVKEYRKKRSLSQNSYMWVLLDEIAKKVDSSKDEIYKTYVKDYGVFEVLPLRNDAVESFIYRWGKNGLGWFCEEIGKSKINGYTNIMAYYGSSTYNTEEMRRLIDAVVTDCKELGINTMTMADIMLLANDND